MSPTPISHARTMQRMRDKLPKPEPLVPAHGSAALALLREIEIHMRVAEDATSFDSELYSRIEAYLQQNNKISGGTSAASHSSTTDKKI